MRSAMRPPVSRSARWSGSAVFGGQWNNVLRKGKRNAGWHIMKYGNMPAGSTLWCSRCWRIFSCGTCRGIGGKKAPALTVSQLRRLFEVVLPLHAYTIEESLAFVAWVQRRNYQAYLAHRKRRETEG